MSASEEQRVFGAIAAVYTSDSFQWVQQGDQVNRVDLYHSPEAGTYRIVSRTEGGAVLINSALSAECVYEQASAQFHQWTGVDDESHGLSFATAKDAASFCKVVQSAIHELCTRAQPEQQRETREDVVDLTRQLPGQDSRRKQALVSAEQLRDLPKPIPFRSNLKDLECSAAAYWRVETLLELCHSAPVHQGVQLTAVSQLVDISDFDQFCAAYQDFNVVDMWMYTEDATAMQRVATQGVKALAAQRGVPVGFYRVRDPLCTTQTTHNMVLCKVALGRTLPMAAGAQLDAQIQLPNGYHSLYVPALQSPEGATLCDDGTPAYFADNYLLVNPHLVLPTHMATFDYTGVELAPIPGSPNHPVPQAGQCFRCHTSMALFFCTQHNRPFCEGCALDLCQPSSLLSLDEMPAIVDCCQSCGTGMPLDRFCRLCGVAVCMDCKLSGRHQGKEHVFESVQESYHSVLSEVHELAETIPPLAARLEQYEQSVENFMLDCMCQVDNFKQDLVCYTSHHLKVGQALEHRRFDVDRIVSDFDRLLEFFYYEEQMCPKVKFVAQYAHFEQMAESIKQRLRLLEDKPAFNRYTMALTEKNKAIVGARRQLMYRQDVIERLAERLQERGVLTPEDEELISTLQFQQQQTNHSIPRSEAEKQKTIRDTRAMLTDAC